MHVDGRGRDQRVRMHDGLRLLIYMVEREAVQADPSMWLRAQKASSCASLGLRARPLSTPTPTPVRMQQVSHTLVPSTLQAPKALPHAMAGLVNFYHGLPPHYCPTHPFISGLTLTPSSTQLPNIAVLPHLHLPSIYPHTFIR